MMFLLLVADHNHHLHKSPPSFQSHFLLCHHLFLLTQNSGIGEAFNHSKTLTETPMPTHPPSHIS